MLIVIPCLRRATYYVQLFATCIHRLGRSLSLLGLTPLVSMILCHPALSADDLVPETTLTPIEQRVEEQQAVVSQTTHKISLLEQRITTIETELSRARFAHHDTKATSLTAKQAYEADATPENKRATDTALDARYIAGRNVNRLRKRLQRQQTKLFEQQQALVAQESLLDTYQAELDADQKRSAKATLTDDLAREATRAAQLPNPKLLQKPQN